MIYKLFKLLFLNKIRSDIENWLYEQECDTETLLWAKGLHDGTYENLNYRDALIRELRSKTDRFT